MSPTSPTFVALNDQLNKAHRRIRELEARELELVARIQLLGIGMRGAEGRHLAPIALERWESDGGAVYPAPQSRPPTEADRATGQRSSVAQAGFATTALR